MQNDGRRYDRAMRAPKWPADDDARAGYPSSAEYGSRSGDAGYSSRADYGSRSGDAGYSSRADYGSRSGDAGYSSRADYGSRSGDAGYSSRADYGSRSGDAGYSSRADYGSRSGDAGYSSRADYGSRSGDAGYSSRADYGSRSRHSTYSARADHGARAGRTARAQSDRDSGRDFADEEARAPGDAFPKGPGALEQMAGAARRLGARLRESAAQRRARASAEAREAREQAVFGGREHDNIHAADARPGVGRAPIVAMILVAVLLVVCVPMLMREWNRRAALGGNGISVQSANSPGISVTAQPGSVPPTPSAAPEITAAPGATDAPAAAVAPEATASGIMISSHTGRALDRNRPAVALTFDDGPSDQTARILDALEANGALGTFFPIGERVAGGEYADALRRLRDMGCLVGTHMYSHSKLTELSADELAQQLSACATAYAAVGLSAPELARAPYGQVSDAVLSAVALPFVNWSLNSNDWQTQDADRIYNDVMGAIQDGDIVMFRDLKDFTAAALERILPALTAQGYQLVTVQELFELKGQPLEAGRLYDQRVVAQASA